MSTAAQHCLLLLLLSGLLLTGSSRLPNCIRLMACQGVVLGLLPVLMPRAALGLEGWWLAGAVLVMKGLVFPWLLFRALRVTQARREIEPFVSYSISLFLGFVALVAAFGVAARLPHLPQDETERLAIAVAFFLIFVGLFIIVARRKAITQILGYLVLENGIYVFGMVLVSGMPGLVELGVLLDALVAVFVMGVATYHINREFDHIDVDELDRLRG